MKSKLLVFFALSGFSSVAIPRPQSPVNPPYVRLGIAGGRVHDVRAGYYLIYTGDGDGASEDVVLTPDKLPPGESNAFYQHWHWVQFGAEGNLPKGRLPRLRTGTGVNIGDSPETVQRKLATAPHAIHVDGRMLAWEYYAVVSMREGKASVTKNYFAEYVFYRNKLWGIYYNLSRPEGC